MSRRTTSRPGLAPLARIAGTLLALLVSISLTLPTSVSAQEATIEGWDWQLLTYLDADETIQSAPPGVAAIVQLFAGSAFGEAACSTYEGTYQRPDRQTLFIDPPVIERVACDPDSEAFDEVFYQRLADTGSVTVSDSIMTLSTSAGEELMTLTRAVIDDDPTVARWELARIGNPDGSIEPVIRGVDPWIEFLRGGRLVGDTGCGSFLGSYQLDDGTMRISDVAYRLEGCGSEGLRRQAEQLVAALDAITDFDVLPAGMALRDEAGRTRLALVPAIDLAGRTWVPVVVYDESGAVPYEPVRFSFSSVRFQGPSADGRTNCRYWEGDSVSSGLALSIMADPKLVGKPCSKNNDQRGVEDVFMRALEATSSQALRGSELELKDVDGVTRMRLLPQAELMGINWVVTGLNPKYARGGSTPAEPLPDTTLTAAFDDLGIVEGDTGASAGASANTFIADYRTPKASQITIDGLETYGRACDGKRASSSACAQQGLYLKLLERADGYVIREGELRLIQRSTPLVWFEPEVFAAPAPETSAP
jgi:heat shock protein HslJ